MEGIFNDTPKEVLVEVELLCCPAYLAEPYPAAAEAAVNNYHNHKCFLNNDIDYFHI